MHELSDKKRSRPFCFWLMTGWTVLVAAILTLYVLGEKKAFEREAGDRAEQIVERDLLFRHWNASFGGVYVPLNNGVEPNPYLEHRPEREVVTPSGKVLTLVDPAQMIWQVSRFSDHNAVQTHLSSITPIRPETAADAWEREGLQQFQQGEMRRSTFLDEGDRKYYRYMRPLAVTEVCVDCHAPHGYQPGEVRGGYTVQLDVSTLYQAYRQHTHFVLLFGFLLWGGGIGSGYLLSCRLHRVEQAHEQGESRLSTAEQSIVYLTYYDPLTGLPNRHLFNERLQSALTDDAGRVRGVAVGVVGIDHYKKLKNTFGLQVGEEVLKEAVRRISTALYAEDLLACLSESRLLLLLPQAHRTEDVSSVVRRIRAALEQPVLLDGQEFFISVTCGFAQSPHDSCDARILISYADAAYSRAKLQGRDSFAFHTERFNQKALEQITMENMLRRALERQQLELYYQPQVDARTGRIIGVEALMRWHKPDVGMIAPAEFIPLAEESGMILPIGEWTMLTACQTAQPWCAVLGKKFTVSVNISPRQFQQLDLVAMVDEALARSGLPPSALMLEVTEGSIVQDVERAVALLTELKRRGIRIAIDDFGTGYSSLNYLKMFPVDQVKIDRSFVSDLCQKGTNSVIVTSIISLAQKLNLEVIAEGVETEEQRDFLQKLGCYCMQGYYYCRPVAADRFTELARSLQDESSESYAWWCEGGKSAQQPIAPPFFQ